MFMHYKITLLLLLALFSAQLGRGQEISWQEITTEYELPEDITVFKGERADPPLECWYMKVDMNNTEFGIRPYYGEENNIVPSLTKSHGAYAAVNGGYFGGGTSYSTILEPGVLKARNVSALTRNSTSYPVMRSFFSYTRQRTFGVDWIYHFGTDTSGIYAYEAPLPYTGSSDEPLPAPEKAEGEQMQGLWTGIGGGPTLVKGDSIRVTYNEEIFWGSGVGMDNRDPRTAVGYTPDGHVILFVADGRKSGISEGVSLPELAEIMTDLGCTEAMNLDGGGSTQMAVHDTYVNAPNENRSVPSILAIVHKDSMKMPGEADYENIIDTEEAEQTGSWIETANEGFYGSTKSLLATVGSGSSYCQYSIAPPADVYSEIYGWWVASGNRSTETPYIIKHKYGTDTVRVNQTVNGSQWQFIGKYVFTGDSSEFVKITNNAATGSYVVADAIKIASFLEEDDYTAIKGPQRQALHGLQISPNPVQNVAHLYFTTAHPTQIHMQLFNMLGKPLKSIKKSCDAGSQHIALDMKDLPGGSYVCVLKTPSGATLRQIILK